MISSEGRPSRLAKAVCDDAREFANSITIAMTLDTYSHFLPSMGDQTVKAMEAALS
jgi:hypothetical protein